MPPTRLHAGGLTWSCWVYQYGSCSYVDPHSALKMSVSAEGRQHNAAIDALCPLPHIIPNDKLLVAYHPKDSDLTTEFVPTYSNIVLPQAATVGCFTSTVFMQLFPRPETVSKQ
jgi:hypothetical protein